MGRTVVGGRIVKQYCIDRRDEEPDGIIGALRERSNLISVHETWALTHIWTFMDTASREENASNKYGECERPKMEMVCKIVGGETQ